MRSWHSFTLIYLHSQIYFYLCQDVGSEGVINDTQISFLIYSLLYRISAVLHNYGELECDNTVLGRVLLIFRRNLLAPYSW
jgi:hypothetical protein